MKINAFCVAALLLAGGCASDNSSRQARAKADSDRPQVEPLFPQSTERQQEKWPDR